MKTPNQFWNRVDKNGPIPEHCPELGTCWLWTGAKLAGKGYGWLLWCGHNQLAHRVAWFLTYGAWPNPQALHHCDNRPCVNPIHLFEGDNAANVADREQKGRHHDCKGEKSGTAKLNTKQVLWIREQLALGVTGAELAKKFAVNPVTIYYIRDRKNWKHI